MTVIGNAPEHFAAEALAGFCDINAGTIVSVRGGLVRRHVESEGKVSVVVGGGAGHFPAFAGFVGPGMADGAVIGDVFASPSAASAASVCAVANQGRGVLLGYGNYAGDVLNFGAAAERLRAAGIDVRLIAVTDDVASAEVSRRSERRGVAGDLVVFKIAAAAADARKSLDEVERLAICANENTVTLGIAFRACTLPGADEPLFSLSEKHFALGLGIHGEPGLSELPMGSSQEIAQLLTDRLLAEAPTGAKKVAAILNGLGGTKYDELFVLWNDVRNRLAAAGLEIVDPIVGEFVTSLDMQGCSLTLTWLDDELERLWRAPCSSYVLQRGRLPEVRLVERLIPEREKPIEYRRAAQASRSSGRCIARVLSSLSNVLKDCELELGRLDAVAGDGDHGAGMARGSHAASAAAQYAVAAGAGAASVLAAAGDAWADRAGGTSGAIWGLLLRNWSAEFSDDTGITDAQVVCGARRALEAVMRLGGAIKGDKTLVDAFIPFVETLESAFSTTGSLSASWSEAAAASSSAAQGTSSLSPRRGRARPLAHRSIGHPDPGAVSLSMCAQNVAGLL